MEQFPHLKFVQKVTGKPRLFGGGSAHPRTLENRNNRTAHSGKLQRWVTQNKSDWSKDSEIRREQKLAKLDENIVPVFIQINPDIINFEFELDQFGIEIISEEENGFILGASLDNFVSLEAKIRDFITAERGSGLIGDFWQIIHGNRNEWKPKHILSKGLFAQWNSIEDDQTYSVEVSIAFDKPMGNEPVKKTGKLWEKYQSKLVARDEALIERENHFEKFIQHYGEIKSGFAYLEDSFGCEVSISGKGLKDLVVNYPFVFEVSELLHVQGVEGNEVEITDLDIEILPPDNDAVEVGVIDSGIMEGHKLLSGAINSSKSRSYLADNTSTADQVGGGGHGTRVAGAILFPRGISKLNSPYRLPCYIRNLRVLDADCFLTNGYPAGLMEQIVNENEDCKIFNLSVSSSDPHSHKHMSSWAAIIDKLSHETGILFVISVGNIKPKLIRHFLNSGVDYPLYLNDDICRIADPSHSLFSLAVGSINHSTFEDVNWTSLGGEYNISGFSRKGNGIWGTIKPDVVEFGGGLVRSKNGLNLIKEHEAMATELIRSKLGFGGNAYGKDTVGTSFSAPKVSNIAATLKRLYPEEDGNLIRAFVAQGARLPNPFFHAPTNDAIKHFGYGVPSLKRVTKNTEHRITFYNTGKIAAEEAHLYSLHIPKELTANEYEILLEITLAYTAQVRRTRQKIKSYLSTWLDWTTAKMDEPFAQFRDFVFKEIDSVKPTYNKATRKAMKNFDWQIKGFVGDKSGNVDELSRTNTTLQKDWTILKSHELPKELSIAVRGHNGWDKKKNNVPYAITVSIEILGADIPIYQTIKAENEVAIENPLEKEIKF